MLVLIPRGLVLSEDIDRSQLWLEDPAKRRGTVMRSACDRTAVSELGCHAEEGEAGGETLKALMRLHTS